MSCEARREEEVDVGREEGVEGAMFRGEAGTELRSGAMWLDWLRYGVRLWRFNGAYVQSPGVDGMSVVPVVSLVAAWW